MVNGRVSFIGLVLGVLFEDVSSVDFVEWWIWDRVRLVNVTNDIDYVDGMVLVGFVVAIAW